jgi:hydroxylamine reductase
VCGKKEKTAKLQDLLIFAAKGVAAYSSQLRKIGTTYDKVDYYILDALFTTITNANFDDEAIFRTIGVGCELRDELREELLSKNIEIETKYEDTILATWEYEYHNQDEEVFAFAEKIGVLRTEDEDVRSLRELIIYGLKGIAAYTEHAYRLGKKKDEIFEFIEKALLATEDDNLSIDELIKLTLDTGKMGVTAMALLDEANTSTYGNPEITKVSMGTRNNPGILISGHDLKDLEMLLEQTKDSGVDVYTHGEMLPGHYYPAFKKYDHFVGNYGGSWWKQLDEFPSFNGPILFTTNCIVPPRKDVEKAIGMIYTTNSAGIEGAKHIMDDETGWKNFSEIIEHAKKCSPPIQIEEGEIVGGFAHNQVLALADKVIDAVKSGAIKKFVVMAGCDGRMANREYYTDFAKALPKDTVILTAGCAKYRYNKLDLGDIGGIPRVLDAGQCNDSYSLAVIAMKLQEAFGLDDINDLPIVYNIAWYEQKAVIVLLALLSLGVKNIHCGPTLPAFLSPNVAKVLVENFGIAGITTVEEDMKIFGIE